MVKKLCVLGVYSWLKSKNQSHKQSGAIFAIETDDSGQVIAACGPLFGKDFAPKMLDYDNCWNTELQANLIDFEKSPRPTTLSCFMRMVL